MAKRTKCPKGFRKVNGTCMPKEEILITSKDVYRPVKDFTEAYSRKDYVEAKRHRMRIERIAGKGAMPYAPTRDERECPMLLAKEVACASNMIRSGRAKGYQANSVCRASLKKTKRQVCPTL